MPRSLRCRALVAGALAGALSLTSFAGPAAGSGAAVPISATEGQAFSGGVATYTSSVTANERFIAQAYLDVLGRRPSVSDLAFFDTFLTGGGTRTELAASLLASDEYRSALVRSIYTAFLRRPASAPEVAAEVALLDGGATDEQVKAIVLGGAEYFVNEGGGTVDGFLQALYLDVLGRPIDSAAETFYTAQLTGGATRTDVALDVLTSLEARQLLVSSIYEQFLHRSPSSSEVAFQVSLLTGGATDEDVIAGLVGSAEYFANVAASFASATVDWGDGTPTSTGSISGSTVSGSHTYAEEGSYPITVTVDDLDGTFTFGQTATVGDAALSATPASFSVAKKTTFTQTVATFTDANPGADVADFTATIDWGDGQTTAGVISVQTSGGFAVQGGHRYDAKGTYPVIVQVQDAGGSVATVIGTARVTNKGTK
jgi:Domain of unknown function (DUF4214)/PKD domain